MWDIPIWGSISRQLCEMKHPQDFGPRSRVSERERAVITLELDRVMIKDMSKLRVAECVISNASS